MIDSELSTDLRRPGAPSRGRASAVLGHPSTDGLPPVLGARPRPGAPGHRMPRRQSEINHLGMVRLTVVVVLGLVCSLSAVPAAAAGPSVGFVRVAHFSPDGPEVDVYVDGARTLAGVAYKAVSSYQPMPAGGHTVDVRAAGASTGVLTSRSLD